MGGITPGRGAQPSCRVLRAALSAADTSGDKGHGQHPVPLLQRFAELPMQAMGPSVLPLLLCLIKPPGVLATWVYTARLVSGALRLPAALLPAWRGQATLPLARQGSPAAPAPAAERPRGTEWVHEARYIDGGGGIWTAAGVSAGQSVRCSKSNCLMYCVLAHHVLT